MDNTAQPSRNELPDLFRFANGDRVRTRADWRNRRRELQTAVVEIEYGGLPPAPGWTRGEETARRPIAGRPGAQRATYRLSIGPQRPFSFTLQVHLPPGDGPFPVVLNGDGCWPVVTDDILGEVLQRGAILAQFNREEIVPDQNRPQRDAGLYLVYPEREFGALSAWAWGYHRCVDFLSTCAFADPARIAVTGHSRGGKTVLLAGATDERIALTAPNDSGAGGAGCYRWQGPNSETLADLLYRFPYWFGPRLREYLSQESRLPFDQHSLKALVAPRAQLSTEALGDLWANPSGTWHTYLAAREAYCFLDAGDNIGIWYRPGEHLHNLSDWMAMLDFMDWRLRGQPARQAYDASPFADLPRAFAWSAPATAR